MTALSDTERRVSLQLARYAWPVARAALFLIALRVIFSELRHFHLHEVAAYIGRLVPSQVALALAATAASYLALAGYDALGAHYGGHDLPLRKTAFASFVSAAVSNTVGLSGIAGGSLRYRLYTSWGLSGADAARVIAFSVATFWLGFLSLAGSVLTLHRLRVVPWLGPVLLILPVIYAALVLSRRKEIGRFAVPHTRLAALQFALSIADWFCAALVFYALLPQSRVSFATTLAVFLAAQVLGVVSNVPGGVGVFEAAVFSLLGPALGAGTLAGALVAYRALYYVLPLFVAGALLGAQEVLRRRTQLSAFGRGLARTVSLFVPSVFSVAIFIDGVILLISGATPAERDRVYALKAAVPLPLVEVAHLVGSMAGAGLLLLARGLQRRLNGAYALSVTLLVAGMMASLLKGLDWEEACLLGITVVAIVPCRRHFYRKTALLDEPFTPGWATAIGLTVLSTMWLGFFAYRRIAYSPELWWHFSFSGDAPRFLRASLAAAAVALAFSARKLLHPAVAPPPPVVSQELDRATEIARGRCAPAGYLVLLNDKSLLFNEPRSAFLMYGVQRRSWVAMGDPIGPPADAHELAWRFFEEADRHNGWPVFYQVRTPLLPLYIELGLRLMKLGEEARVATAGFTLAGRDRKSLRHTVKRLETEGTTFEVISAEAASAMLPELRRVSNDWLSTRNTREKRFSLGFFDDAYMQRLPVALIRYREELVAFANLWGDDVHEELTVDLMRHSTAAPSGVMDFLFVNLILHAQSLNYRWFNLGMAPLSGLEARAQGPLWSRVAALGFEHGGHFYNFQGLRQYKQKFDPVWEPIFLASPGGLRLPLILTDIAALVSGSVRGILMK
ncbi:MAG: bifunctional lysylphosphatidylglycerol flippase/synthetase MprF [Acidobacteria bacterium]|nr:bifunctional lysylphosphatidylglycerol flippase/synthetase MprF [Acidobacteriota bacterium]MBV9478569.1 bifunctional lysylphosphatidylglycerol flippase/synthetase MprF [Acidobacteriota bacterium]